MNRQNTLIVFIKNPEKGKVKTRLASIAGNETALLVYQFLLEKTRTAALEVACHRMLCYSNYIPTADEWPDTHFLKSVQSPGNLGQRMSAAFHTAFFSGAQKTVIIGSDCPGLDASLIRQAFDALDNTDYVLGPACDGGYYLLGMKKFSPELFEGIPWSTASVAADTIRLINAHNGNYTLLPQLSDIDEYEDWTTYLHANPEANESFCSNLDSERKK